MMENMLTSRNQKQKWAAVCIALLMGLASTAGVRAQTPPSDTLTLNFVNADIEDVARTLAILSGKNVVVDPKVKGKIDLITDTPVGANRAIEQFATALRLRNWALIQSDGLLRSSQKPRPNCCLNPYSHSALEPMRRDRWSREFLSCAKNRPATWSPCCGP